MKKYPELPKVTIQQWLDEKYGEGHSRKVIDVTDTKKAILKEASSFNNILKKDKR